jgi:hypothetical protein
MPLLPHLTIRPPGLLEINNQKVLDLLSVILNQVSLSSLSYGLSHLTSESCSSQQFLQRLGLRYSPHLKFVFQEVECAIFPLKEENVMKSYLLHAQERAQIVTAAGGHFKSMSNALSIQMLLQDRIFICLHYFLDSEGILHPCNSSGRYVFPL